ncbi:hypothetical protein [Mycobacterium sp. 3519A]|uniref:hypothetical protein n=1 Tax=Mycobacterium sp. 3519A TaxID=2057184 RepID=UPI00190EE33D|nr:hypothetical protein [Mycobacterium sp. 3519A]
MFDRSDDEWDAIVVTTQAFLEEKSRARLITSYSEVSNALAEAGHRPFDFSMPSDRNAVGAVLGDVVERTIGDTGIMLSAIVAYIDRNDAGPGFYNLAVQLGLLSNVATSDDKLMFWSSQVAKIHDLYARPRKRSQ